MTDWRRKRWKKAAPRAPWTFSEAPDPAEAVPNEPTAEGRALGSRLARFADLAEEEQREQFPNMVPRCSDCAFRAGTLPNGCEETLMDAIKCVVDGVPFYCHKGMKDGDAPKRLCSGAMVLYQGRHGNTLRTAVGQLDKRRK